MHIALSIHVQCPRTYSVHYYITLRYRISTICVPNTYITILPVPPHFCYSRAILYLEFRHVKPFFFPFIFFFFFSSFSEREREFRRACTSDILHTSNSTVMWFFFFFLSLFSVWARAGYIVPLLWRWMLFFYRKSIDELLLWMWADSVYTTFFKLKKLCILSVVNTSRAVFSLLTLKSWLNFMMIIIRIFALNCKCFIECLLSIANEDFQITRNFNCMINFHLKFKYYFYSTNYDESLSEWLLAF